MMKGSLHTDELMKAAMHRETGLRTARRICMCSSWTRRPTPAPS